MSFFDDFSKTASSVFGKAAKGVESATKTAVRRSSDFAEVSKLKMKISAEQKAVDDLYYEIGKKVYADSMQDGIVLETVQDECATIYEHKARIAELNGKIELIRGGNQFETEASESEVDFDAAEETIIEEVEVPQGEDADFAEPEDAGFTVISETQKKKEE